MDSMKLLEDRISVLEKKVYGSEKIITPDDKLPENSVIDNLLHTNTLISSALSGREKASAIMKRLSELSEYLDPVIEDADLPLNAKLQLLLATQSDIRQNYNLLSKVQELEPVLDTERIRDVPELTGKLNNLTLSYLKTNNESEALNAQVIDVFDKYSSVMNSITRSLFALDAAVTAAEIAALPKKVVD